MKKHEIQKLAILLGLALATSAQAASTSWSLTAPTVNDADIAQLGAFAGGADANNVQNGADAATYIAFDQPAQGQTFTTGSDPLGYTLNAITVKHAENTGGLSLDSGWDPFGGRFQLFVGQITGGVFSHDLFEESSLGGNDPDSPGYNSGTGNNTGPQGGYVTFTLATPFHLLSNTTYGYSVYTLANQFGGGYFPSDGTNTNAYAGGNAFSEAGGAATEFSGGDRVFHLDVASVPEPATFAMLVAGVGIFAARRRRLVAE